MEFVAAASEEEGGGSGGGGDESMEVEVEVVAIVEGEVREIVDD